MSSENDATSAVDLTDEQVAQLTNELIESWNAPAVDVLELESGDVALVENGFLSRVHSASKCAGENCWVHNPSPTHMATWPINWRDDNRTAERLCEHGVGHPDLDDVTYNARLGRDTTIHGCDGCCEA